MTNHLDGRTDVDTTHPLQRTGMGACPYEILRSWVAQSTSAGPVIALGQTGDAPRLQEMASYFRPTNAGLATFDDSPLP